MRTPIFSAPRGGQNGHAWRACSVYVWKKYVQFLIMGSLKFGHRIAHDGRISDLIFGHMCTELYPLMSCRTAGDKYGNMCFLCNQQEETLSHFLLSCPCLPHTRSNYMNKISKISHHDIYTLNVHTQVGLLLNTVHIPYTTSTGN